MDRDSRAWSALRAEFERAGCDAISSGYEDDILDEAGLSPEATAEEVRRGLVRVLVADPDAEAWVRSVVADDHGEDLAAQLTAADCQALRAEWADAWAASATSALAMEELERRARERAREQEDQDHAPAEGRQGDHDAQQ